MTFFFFFFEVGLIILLIWIKKVVEKSSAEEASPQANEKASLHLHFKRGLKVLILRAIASSLASPLVSSKRQ